ncbi:unnamed protein product [Ectocarpus sp. 6 AP-2014]
MVPCREPHYSQCPEEVEDLIELQSGVWDEELVLQNCRARFLAGKPYIGAGNVAIAVNPCRNLDELYDRDMQFRYMKYNRTDLPVHVYATSASAYWRLSEGLGRQTILLAGESGSGKSFTASVLLEHLVEAAEMSRRVYGTTAQNERGAFSGGMTTVEDDGGNETGRLRKLVASRRVILETFGNAGTPLNESSSRFMAHTKVFYSKHAFQAAGIQDSTLLLETPRLCNTRRGRGERTFNAFYQMLGADETVKMRLRLGDKTAVDFAVTAFEPSSSQGGEKNAYDAAGTGSAWLGGSIGSIRNTEGCAGPPSVSVPKCGSSGPSGAGGLHKTLDSMATIGVSAKDRESTMRVLSAVLHLGQIDFADVKELIDRDFGVIEIRDEAPLEAASDMLGCNKHHLRNALLTRSLAAGGEGGAAFVSRGGSRRTRGVVDTLTVPLDKAQALRARDNLVQEVYLRLFKWLVKTMNACTGLPSDEKQAGVSSIGLLDMFGSENLDPSGFEQLCKNYAVEKIHGRFLQDEVCYGNAKGGATGRTAQASAVAEVESNRRLLAMFEGPLGLIRLADDECLCPEGNGQSFVNKLLLLAATEKETRQDSRGDGGACSGCSRLVYVGDGDEDCRCRGGAVTGGRNSAWPACIDPNTSGNRLANSCFHIKHFGGPVRYTAADLLEKNKGGVGQGLLDLLDDVCTNDLIGKGSRSSRYRDGRRASTVDGAADHRRQNLHQRRLNESVLSQHRRQLTELLREIEDTKVRHIVCIKPNDQLSPSFLDGRNLLRQLSSAGVAAAAERGILSLPSGRRVDKEAFFNDFRVVPGAIQRVLNNEGNCCKLGHGTIFFRKGVWESLERRREAVERRGCEAIQRIWRQHARRVRANAEWQAHLAVEAENRAVADRRQQQLEEERKQAWENEASKKASQAEQQTLQEREHQQQRQEHRLQSVTVLQETPCRPAVFESSHANVVREAKRAQEAAQAATAGHDRAWRLHCKALDKEARLEAGTAAAERNMPDDANRMSCTPPPVVQAWPVDGDISEEQLEETTAAGTAHRHRGAFPMCSPIPDRSEVERAGAGGSSGSASAHEARRVVPRLAGLADYAMRAFLTEPVPKKYGAIRCRVARKEGSGWNPMASSVYDMHHIEGGMVFMMSATRQPLSRTANYYISASPYLETTKDTRGYMGKLRARDGSGRAYVLYDDGVSPRRSSKDRRRGLFSRKELARVVFSATQNVADGPRSMEAFVPGPAEWYQAGDLETYNHPWDDVMHLRDRKPRYDRTVGAYVLDFPNSTSKLSIKNVQLVVADDHARGYIGGDNNQRNVVWEDRRSGNISRRRREWDVDGREQRGEWWAQDTMLLSFGKSGVDEFALDFRYPLSPMQAFGMALAALDTSV